MDEIPAWLEGARLAPSAHNTQPWRFVGLANGHVRVRWDPGRALPYSDPTNRDLYLGIGAAIEAACLRSAASGRPLRFVVDRTGEAGCVGTLVPTEKKPEHEDSALARSLETRHTGRSRHLGGQVSPVVTVAMRAEAVRAGLQLWVVDDVRSIRLLASLARHATAAAYADSIAHRELWHWLRLDPRDPAYRRDGLTADCLELNRIGRFAARQFLSPRCMQQLVRLRIHQLMALDTARIVRQSSSLCLLTLPENTRDSMVMAGRTLLRIWLLADGAGMSTHPISALLDCPRIVDSAVEVFGATAESPASIFRLGVCRASARAPRLPASELVEPLI